jgi:undecaprenyl diphosphate synthase
LPNLKRIQKLSEDLKKLNRLPKHIAIIMDGNGRWAKKRMLPRIKGHEQGSQSVISAIRSCKKIGIKYLTLYAFSVENWARPKDEISGLMNLLIRFIKKYEKELHANKVRLRVLGRMEDMPEDVQVALNKVIEDTSCYTEYNLNLALSYGGRTEIVSACTKISRKVLSGALKPEDINENIFADNLYLPDIPDPDLMIRTSGEMRISNFLLWQLSYAEFYITDVLWPDFREKEFYKALLEYSNRDRRFGKVQSEQ